jgi:hypothetical protein
MRWTPGALYLKWRQTFGHGLRVAYFRDVVRRRILRSSPVIGNLDDRCEIHVLTSHRDWLNLLWVLKSYYLQCDSSYKLTIHDDGSLDPPALEALASHFPDARIVARSEADLRVTPLLAELPRAREFRRTNPLALKVFDFEAFLESERMLLLDSDVLFFSKPQALIDRIEDPAYRLNSLNRDWRYGYSIDIEASRDQLDFALEARINSGLGLVHRNTLRLDWIEAFLGLPGIFGHHHRIEQTLYALCCCRHGFAFLPEEYDVHVGPWLPQHPCRHYTAPIRHRLYSEGIDKLRKGLLE